MLQAVRPLIGRLDMDFFFVYIELKYIISFD